MDTKQKPIIDPSTLTEEQRELIRNRYRDNYIGGMSIDFGFLKKENFYEVADHFAENCNMVEWIFGKDFFEDVVPKITVSKPNPIKSQT